MVCCGITSPWLPQTGLLACGRLQIRDKMIDLALNGNEAVDRYGDLITNKGACYRFLKAHKGKVRYSPAPAPTATPPSPHPPPSQTRPIPPQVDEAVDSFKKHLEWRVSYGCVSHQGPVPIRTAPSSASAPAAKRPLGTTDLCAPRGIAKGGCSGGSDSCLWDAVRHAKASACGAF